MGEDQSKLVFEEPQEMNMLRAYLECGLIYIAIGIAGACSIIFLPLPNNTNGSSMLLSFLFADFFMTIVSYMFSYVMKNSSVYDAYWSVIPFYFLLSFGILGDKLFSDWDISSWLVFGVVSFWSWRLTFNWARQWTGWCHEDWRYVDMRKEYSNYFEFINFAGIHLFPTVLVFGGCIPLFWIYSKRSDVSDPYMVSLLIIGILMSFCATCIQGIADDALIKFRRRPNPQKGEILEIGFWKVMRNPNYFGEMMFWWGLALCGIACEAPVYISILGAISITALFVGISVPLKETRMAIYRTDWDGYCKRVPTALIPGIY